MDIINELPDKRFAEVDDLLAFVSIYDDRRRMSSYLRLLRGHRRLIRGAVCVDAGCGLGYFSDELVRLGAARVYAVEANPVLFDLAQRRLGGMAAVRMINDDVRNLKPKEGVDVLVHEFFGQMLYDEDVHVLERLRFTPRFFLPDGARLMAGLAGAEQVCDENVSRDLLQRLEGALVSGLFEDRGLPLHFPVLDWRPGRFQYKTICELAGLKGEVLYFGLQILQKDTVICQSAQCDNWSFVWTPRCGDRFELSFPPDERGRKVKFKWMG